MTVSGRDPDTPGDGTRPPGVTISGSTAVQVGSGNVQYVVQAARERWAVPTVPRSAYMQTVATFCRDGLDGRDRELEELAAFCAGEGDRAYIWWRAEAWAGKSALLSWFVLHPPAGVDVVAFFITARYPAQDGRAAFVEVVMEQLAERLGQPLPHLPKSTQEAHLLAMLEEAAWASQANGRRLVLVLDGLDEDRGVTTGPDAYSVAALLPAQPVAGMRVVVAGRPHPPVPADVPADHPLRDASIVRTLTRSPRAQVIRVELERELKHLLAGTEIQQELLGFVVAARGGLDARDLAELTGRSRWEIDQNLRAVAGRTFASRPSGWQPAGPQVYVFAHEELHGTAVEALGPARLAGYRQRLHDWADGYRDRGWPAGTPEYLLRDYFRLLRDADDVARLVTCAVDAIRHDRMLDITRSDAAALIEIAAAQDAVLACDRPDLHAMARLAMHRDDLADRNARIPVELPAVWASLGQVERAENMAGAITYPVRQAEALIVLAEAMAEAGDRDRAMALAVRAEGVIESITDADRRPAALMALAKLLAAAGDLASPTMLAERAERDADALVHPVVRSVALTRLAEAVCAAGDPHRAVVLAERAVRIAGAVTDPGCQQYAATTLVKVVAAAGQLDRAERLASAIGDPRSCAAQAQAVAAVGDLDRAEHIAGAITNPYWHAQAWTAVAAEAGSAGAIARAERITEIITRPDAQAHVWSAVAKATAAVDPDRAVRAAEHAERAAATVTDPYPRAQAWIAVAKATAAWAPDRAVLAAEHAEHGAATSIDQQRRSQALLTLAEAVAAAGDLDRAEKVAYAVTDPVKQVQAWNAIAKAAAASGDVHRVVMVAERVESIADGIADRQQRSQALCPLAEAVAAVGDLDRAERIAGAITVPQQLVRAWAAVAKAARSAGMDPERAAAAAERAEHAAYTLTDPHGQGWALLTLVEALAAAAVLDRAEQIAASIPDRSLQAQAWAAVAKKAATIGDLDRATSVARQAEHVTSTITNSRHQVYALLKLVEAWAAAGDLDRAEHIAAGITDPHQRTYAWSMVVRAAAAVDPDRAMAAVKRAERAADAVGNPHPRAWALRALAEALADAGYESEATAVAKRAEQIADTISDPHVRARTWTALARTTGPGHAQLLVGRAFRVTWWTTPLEALVNLDLPLLARIVDERLGKP